jgi:hypothetical protein
MLLLPPLLQGEGPNVTDKLYTDQLKSATVRFHERSPMYSMCLKILL